MELGRSGAYTSAGGNRIFGLITAVGRTWLTLSILRELLQQAQIFGPWEFSVSLINTSGALLGGLAQGWLQPESGGIMRKAFERNAIRIIELEALPDADDARSFALETGDWIENVWGSRLRRYLANVQGWSPTFDTSQYSS
jgi:hypothetical protein